MTKKHRIAVFLNDMNVAGGTQRVAANLVRDLSRRYDTLLLSVEPLSNPVFYDPNLDFRSLNFRRKATSRSSYILEFVRIARKLKRFVAKNEIDTVLTIWYEWSCVAALALPMSIKKIGCEHISFWEAPRFWQFMRRVSYPRLDAVVTLTQVDLPHLSKIARSVQVIPNALHMTEVVSTAVPREKILLTIGHLIPRKGIDRLLWALEKPLHDHPDWRLVIVGGGEQGHTDWGYLHYVATLLKLLRLDGRVEFHPATKRIDEWYRRASVYVLGSREEGLPMVLIEAKAYGLPIVSFDCPTGPKQIIQHGIDGFLIQNDSYEFGEAVSTLMTDLNLWHRMSAAALEDVHNRFSVEAVTEKWYALIESLHQGQFNNLFN